MSRVAMINRGVTLIVGGWAGMLLTLAWLAAPSAFAVLPHDLAGRVAARFFRLEAHASLVLGLLMMLFVLGRARLAAGSFSAVDLLFSLLAVCCTSVGYFALQPIMSAARAGQTAWSFAAWHGVSMLFFAVKVLAVLALSWRLSAPVVSGINQRPSS